MAAFAVPGGKNRAALPGGPKPMAGMPSVPSWSPSMRRAVPRGRLATSVREAAAAAAWAAAALCSALLGVSGVAGVAGVAGGWKAAAIAVAPASGAATGSSGSAARANPHVSARPAPSP